MDTVTEQAPKNGAPPPEPRARASNGSDVPAQRPTPPTDAEYEKMTHAERSNYAREHKAWEQANPGSGERPVSEPAPPSGDPAKIKIGEIETSEAEIRELMADKAKRESILLTIPTPNDYDLALPKDLTLPPGVSFVFKPDDPVLGSVIQSAQEFAHRHGLSQGAFSELLGLHAAAVSKEQTTLNAAIDAEVKKLGPAAGARSDAIGIWLKSMVGDDLAGSLMTNLISAKQTQAFEKLMQGYVNGGGNNFSQRGRDNSDPSTLSDEQYENLSFSEKRAYAAKHQQPGNGAPAASRKRGS